MKLIKNFPDNRHSEIFQGKTDMNPPFTVHLTYTDYSAIRTALLLYLWKVQDRIKGGQANPWDAGTLMKIQRALNAIENQCK